MSHTYVCTCYLIAIVPPGHDSGMLRSVLSEPEIGLAEIIQDVARSGQVQNQDTLIKVHHGSDTVGQVQESHNIRTMYS